MLKGTEYTVELFEINRILANTLIKEFITASNEKEILSLNDPTGNFFYDRWKIKEQFKNSGIEKILTQLPNSGEARIISLPPERCYRSHADIDDRYHLTLQGHRSYLIDLEENKMFPTDVTNRWAIMDAGKIHSAVNFGSVTRIQLVVRQLLQKNILNNPMNIFITPSGNGMKEKSRFIFDDKISPWLNRANKQNKINNFNIEFDNQRIYFDIDKIFYNELKSIIPEEFQIGVL